MGGHGEGLHLKVPSLTRLGEVKNDIGATSNLESELDNNDVVGVIQLGDYSKRRNKRKKRSVMVCFVTHGHPFIP